MICVGPLGAPPGGGPGRSRREFRRFLGRPKRILSPRSFCRCGYRAVAYRLVRKLLDVLMCGLTGGIGSGKSTVAAMLVERGAVVVDADAIAREVVEPGTPA